MDTKLLRSMISKLKKETESLIKKRTVEENKLKSIQKNVEEYDFIIQDNLDRITLLEGKMPIEEEVINENTDTQENFEPIVSNFIEKDSNTPDDIFQGKLFNN